MPSCFSLRARERKDGKEHHYWSLVENRRVDGGRKVVQRHVLYLGEINSQQQAAWRKTIEIFEAGSASPAPWPCFPKTVLPHWRMTRSSASGWTNWNCAVRGNGAPAGWPAISMQKLGLGRFLGRAPAAQPQRHALGSCAANAGRLPADRSGQRMASAPGMVREQRDGRFAGRRLTAKRPRDTLYHCQDQILEHKECFSRISQERWKDLFNAEFDVLLYDLTSTYFESDPPFAEGDKRRFGYSRDKRSDCVQVVIALIVTPEGFPLGYEVMAGKHQRQDRRSTAFWKRSKSSMARRNGSG